MVSPHKCKFPCSIFATLFEEALHPFQIHLKPMGTSENFQVRFQNLIAFKHFIDNYLPLVKILTKSAHKPFTIQFSFDCFADGLQDEALYDCFADKLEYIGINLEHSFKTGIYRLEFPNVEFLFIFIIKTLQNLNEN
ncbi:MAG: hypothetical protein ACTSYI_06770 [Promethearchaeota archaeon]